MKPAEPAAPRRPWPLSRHLVVLVVGSLVPLVLFAAAAVVALAQAEHSAAERRIQQSARILAEAVDRELTTSLRVLAAMANSPHLASRDLQGFRGEAGRMVTTQPSWIEIRLADASGRTLLDTATPPGDPLPAAVEPRSLLEVVRTRQPLVGDLAYGGGVWAFPVRVPVVADGEVVYVLTAVIAARAVQDLLATELSASGEWTRTVVDRQGTVVARSRDAARYVGKPGTPTFLQRTRSASEGLVPETTLEGVPVYMAFSRAQRSGWTAVLAVPRGVVDGPARRSLLGTGLAALVVLLASGTGAWVLSRRVSWGISSATAAADALAGGARPRVDASGVAELAHLGAAIGRSADLLTQRGRERDELLHRAQEARAEAEAASQAKDQFLAMLGHELRNPLAPIVTALELLRLKGLAGTREHEILQRQVAHLTRLVDDLLDVSRITRGLIELERRPLELGAVAARAVEISAPLMERRGHALEVDVPPEGLPVLGDPVRLAQVISNLLTNAARYTQPGGRIRMTARPSGDGEVVLEVADNGTGLDPKLLPRVFDLFVQGPRELDRHEGGLGVGLTLVRSLVALHGGRVEARSDGPGRGSTFVVRLPLLAGAAPALAPSEARAAGPGPAAVAARVLLVDDNVDALELLGELLRESGHEVVTAEDALDALVALEDVRPDVAVVDIGLPGMDGYALAAEMRARLGDDAPALVALTGYGQAADHERSGAEGFALHLVKPVAPVELLAAVDALARARRRERAPGPPPD